MAFTKIDEHFLKMAQTEGQKSTLKKTKRGAVLAKGNKILSVGVSQRLETSKIPVMQQTGEEERYIATINAAVHALGNAIKAGLNINGATLYMSDQIDWYTFKLIYMVGIKRICFYGPFTNERVKHYSQKLGVEVIAIG